MSEPTTEAGRRLLNDVREVTVHGVTDRIQPGFDLAWRVRDGIAAIEAEARADLAHFVKERLSLVPLSAEDAGEPSEFWCLHPEAVEVLRAELERWT